MSIFTKDCPVCAASHPIHQVRCACGHCFDPNKLDGVTQELEVIAQEERLYRDYLSARADQAEKARDFAKTSAAMDPNNNVKAADALLAEQIALTARAEMEAQEQRARAVKERIKVVRSNRRARKAKAPASASPAAASIPATPRAAPKPKSAIVAMAPARVEPASEAPRAPVSAPKHQPADPSKKFDKPQPPVATAAVPKNGTNHHPIATALPPPPAQFAPMPPSKTPAVVREIAPAAALPQPTPVFRATQATKAAQFAGAPATHLECPNCSSKVPANAKRCRCGYEMPLSASQIPSLALSPEDRAALLAALSPSPGRRDG